MSEPSNDHAPMDETRPPGLHPAIRTGQYCDLPDGNRLHYASCGKQGDPLLLFVHGFPEFWYAWRAMLPAFGAPTEGKAWFAVAPDLRGYNLSSKPVDVADYRAKFLVQDLVGLARSLGYQKFHLVGHDWGGAVTWTLAQLQPDCVEKLIVLNAPHPVPFARALANDPAQQAASAYMNFLREPGSQDKLLANDMAMLEGFLTRDLGAETDTGSGRGWFSGTVRDAYRRAWSQPRALASAINYYRVSPLYPPIGDDPGAKRFDLKAEDFQIRMPTLVIWGQRDAALLPVVIEGLQDCVPDLQIEPLPDATHWLVHEQPDAVARLIRRFIE